MNYFRLKGMWGGLKIPHSLKNEYGWSSILQDVDLEVTASGLTVNCTLRGNRGCFAKLWCATDC